MTRPDPPNSATPPPAPGPVLEYRTPVPFSRVYRPPRKSLPTPFCVGFGSACLAIIVAWGILYWLSVHHCAWIIFGAVSVIGAALCAFKKIRLAGIAVIVAVDVWFLMIGFCFAIGACAPFVL
jgi:hypothetical protein